MKVKIKLEGPEAQRFLSAGSLIVPKSGASDVSRTPPARRMRHPAKLSAFARMAKRANRG